jgi:exosome complex component RRP45
MGGRMTISMNTHGDVCAVQKGGGVGVSQSEIMRCFRVAAMKAADITAKLKDAVSEFFINFMLLFWWFLLQIFTFL